MALNGLLCAVYNKLLTHSLKHRIRLSLYTVFQKKPNPLMFDNNFGKCGPIFIILSPGDL